MATERCIELLLESKDFGALDTDDQANRLAHFMSDWFNQDHKLDTVDHVRLTARLRTHASKMRISAGEVMEILLPIARKLHAQSVYEREPARIRDEDRRAQEISAAQCVSTQPPRLPFGDTQAQARGHPQVPGDTPAGDVHESAPPAQCVQTPAQPVQEPTPMHRARSKSKARAVNRPVSVPNRVSTVFTNRDPRKFRGLRGPLPCHLW